MFDFGWSPGGAEESYAPPGLQPSSPASCPTASAVGYLLTPLRGSDDRSVQIWRAQCDPFSGAAAARSFRWNSPPRLVPCRTVPDVICSPGDVAMTRRVLLVVAL